MSSDKRGYKIPENIAPENLRCIRLYIPDDDYYLYALHGSFEFLTRWVAWEKDGTVRASIAAAAWRQAYEYTMQNGWLNCGEDCEMNQDEIIDLIIERLCEMCICGCGCSGNDQQVIVYPPPSGWVPGPEPPTIPTPTDPLDLLWKCNMAHYMVYLLRYWAIIPAGDWGGSHQVLLGAVNDAYEQLGEDPPSIVWQAIIALIAIALEIGEPNVDQIVPPYDANYDFLVCQLYTSSTTTEAKSNLQQAITSVYSGGQVATLLNTLVHLLPFETLFTPKSFSFLPPSYQNRDCSGCSSPLPPSDDAWYFQPDERISSPYPTVNSTDIADMELAGTCKRVGNIGFDAKVNYLDYGWNAGFEVWDTMAAVAFSVESMGSAPGYTANGNNGFQYGNDGARTHLDLNGVAAGDTVLIQRLGHEQPDAGTFDHVFTVETSNFLATNFMFKRYDYQVPDTVVDFSVSSFEVRLVT